MGESAKYVLDEKCEAILQFLREARKEVRMRDLIRNLDKLGMSKQTLVNKLKELEEIGWIVHRYDLKTRPPASLYSINPTIREIADFWVHYSIIRENLRNRDFLREKLLTGKHADAVLDALGLEKKLKEAKGIERAEIFRKVLEIGLFDICFNTIIYLSFIAGLSNQFRDRPEVVGDIERKIKRAMKSPRLSPSASVFESWFRKFLEIVWNYRGDLLPLLEEVPEIKVEVKIKER